MIIRITKVKLKDRTFIVDYVETLDDKTERRHKGVECDQLVHQDAVNAFSKLKIHLVKLFELQEGKNLTIGEDMEGERINFNPEDHLTNFEVDSISISGSEDNEGVVLSGHKELKSGKILNLTTPFTMYQDEEDDYEYGGELASDIHAVISETEQYLFYGKYAVKQAKIDFDTDVNASSDQITDVDFEDDEEVLLKDARDEFKEATGASTVKITLEGKKSKGKGKKIDMFSNESVNAYAGEATM